MGRRERPCRKSGWKLLPNGPHRDFITNLLKSKRTQLVGLAGEKRQIAREDMGQFQRRKRRRLFTGNADQNVFSNSWSGRECSRCSVLSELQPTHSESLLMGARRNAARCTQHERGNRGREKEGGKHSQVGRPGEEDPSPTLFSKGKRTHSEPF